MIFVTGSVDVHHEHVETGTPVLIVEQVVPVAMDSENPVFVLVTGTTVTV